MKFFVFPAVALAQDIKDIKPPVYFPANYLWLILFIAVVILAVLAYFIMFFLRKNLRKKEILPSGPQKSPHQKAYEALEALRVKNLPGYGRMKEYYFELSDIVRIYIEDRFGIRAPEMTTEEFLLALRESDILSGIHKNSLKDFLSLCDIVKFAKYAPLQKETDDSYEAARRFIDETKIVEEAEEVTIK